MDAAEVSASTTGVDLIFARSEDLLRDGLREWIALGGVAIVFSGTNTVTPAIEGRPIKIPGSAVSNLTSGSPVDGVRLQPRPGSRVIASVDGTTLAVRSRLGYGRIVHLAFDPALVLHSDLSDFSFWRELLQASTSSGSALGLLQGSHDSLYYMSVGRQVDERPKIHAIGLFLLLYLLMMVPVNYFVLRRLRRKEYAWVTMPVLVIIFSLTAYGLGSHGRGKESAVRQVEMAELESGSDLLRYSARLSVYAASKGFHEVEIADPSSRVSDVEASAYDRLTYPALTSVRTSSSVSIPRMAVYMWATRTLAMTGVRRVEGTVNVDLTTDGQRVRGTVENTLPFELTNCTLIGDKLFARIGKLSPGGRTEVDEEYRDTSSIKNLKVWEFPIGGVFFSRLLRSDSILLTGILSRPACDVRLDGLAIPGDYDGLLVVHTSPKFLPSARGTVKGKVVGQIYDSPSRTARRLPLPYAQFPSIYIQERSVTVRYELPLDPSACDYSVLSIEKALTNRPPERMYYDESGRRTVTPFGEVEVYDFTSGKWEKIGLIDAEKLQRITLERPQRAIGPGGLIKIRLSAITNLEDLQMDLRLAFEGRAK